MGLAHSYMNQPNEIPELSESLRALLHLGGEYPTILLRLGYAARMPYSLRRMPHYIAPSSVASGGR